MEILRKIIRKVLSEQYINDNETFWAWVSPDNNLIRVPKLKHSITILRNYPDLSYDMDKAFDKAFEDGWVRVIYEYNPSRFKGTLHLNGYNEYRVGDVLINIFGDLIKYGYKDIYLDYESPKGTRFFSTFSLEGKRELMSYLSMTH